MRFLFLLLSFAFYQDTTSKDRVYILFNYSNESPSAYFKMDSTTKEKNIVGTFTLEKKSGDCSVNYFTFFKYLSPQSIVKVKLDTLQNVVTSEWVTMQPDNVLLHLFSNKDIYIIPKDSLKANVGNAYITRYRFCEEI